MAKNNNLDQNKISLLQELWWCGIIIKLHVFDKKIILRDIQICLVRNLW